MPNQFEEFYDQHICGPDCPCWDLRAKGLREPKAFRTLNERGELILVSTPLAFAKAG